MITLREFAKEAMCGKSHKKKTKKLGAYLQKKAAYRIISSRSKRLAPGATVVTSKSKRKY